MFVFLDVIFKEHIGLKNCKEKSKMWKEKRQKNKNIIFFKKKKKKKGAQSRYFETFCHVQNYFLIEGNMKIVVH